MKYFYFLSLVLLTFCSCSNNENNNTDNAETSQDSVIQIHPGHDSIPDPGPPAQPGQKPVFKAANIEKISVKENGSQLEIKAEGFFPSVCTHLGEIKQEITESNINITIFTFSPPGVPCPQNKMPLTHVVPVDMKSLKSNTYEVNVNGIKTTYTKK